MNQNLLYVCDKSFQDRMEREMQQLMFEQDEETIELKETFTTLQQEVEFKTKKLKKVCKVFDTHTHKHTCWFLWFMGTLHRRNGFYTVQTVCALALHLNLALTGDGVFQLTPQKTHTVWFISILNYGDTENVLINHLLLVLPMSYPCHYTNVSS